MSGHTFLGRYEMVKPLGEGSMGLVYLARDRDGKQVAVKVMHEHIAKQPKFCELFEREMEVMSKFQHPNVVGVYEASAKDPNDMCLVMEYVPGTDLEVVLREQGRLSVERTGHILAQLCSALEAAHAEGIIHRDLKPANLMVMHAGTPQEKIKVMDFGLATLTDAFFISLDKLKGDTSDIATGTAEYMAPEQVRGDSLDHRGDIYSVGIMLFEMLTGKLPFDSPSISELLMAHAEDPIPSFASKGTTDVPRTVEKLVGWCLAKYPVERPQSARELAQQFGSASGVPMGDMTPVTPSGILRMPISSSDLPEYAAKHEMVAFMPEKIAVVKLRGFVDDKGGEMIESIPGMIRVRFGQKNCRYQVPVPRGGALGWIAGPKNALIDVELRMRKVEGNTGSELHVTLLIRPGDGGAPPKTSRWESCCNAIYKDLRSYLMGR